MATKNPVIIDAVIPAGQALSQAIPLGPYSVVGFIMPSAWTAAAVTFAAADPRASAMGAGGSNQGYTATFNKVIDDTSTEVSITSPAANTVVTFKNNDVLVGMSYIKVRSGTAATPVNQVAQATIGLICREM